MKSGTIRVASKTAGSWRGNVRCRECAAATNEGKPLCVEHVVEMDHAKILCEELRRRNQQDRLAERGQISKIDVGGTRAREILDFLAEQGARSLGEVGRHALLTPEVVESYAVALQLAGLLQIVRRKSRRGRRLTFLALA